jgi:hypothetical protein
MIELTPDQIKQAKVWADLREKYPNQTTEEIISQLPKNKDISILEENIRVIKQRPAKGEVMLPPSKTDVDLLKELKK